ncbi:MAG TPA: phenylalanine--tRNA ligase subunit beta [Nitrospira sp.]|nr:phenylalanine--tRNA ligase subunit beta [Nitrospira sp.]
MPTITIFKQDLEALLTADSADAPSLTVDQLEESLMLVKGELKGHNAETGELRVELQDSNRPDLWCCEGIARQIRTKRTGRPPRYDFLSLRDDPKKRVVVSPGLEAIRPYVAACAAIGYRVTDHGLTQLIQTQEKLADIFGRKRRTVSIGLYRLQAIEFPVNYAAVNLESARFTPLGMDTVMTLAEILLVHPKGLEFGGLLSGHDKAPLLTDAKGRVLSFPPIINSREVGEVRIGDDALFIEVTGTDLPMVVLTLNILAANFTDRGATIEPVQVLYPWKTELGDHVTTPRDLGEDRSVPLATIQQALGQALDGEEVTQALTTYGYTATLAKDQIIVRPPIYRHDFMHAMDVVEDVAISRGFQEFLPVMPSQFTVGGLSPIETLSDRVRDLLVGMGFQEIVSNILSSPHLLSDAMRLSETDWGRVVEIENVMSQNFSALRQWMIPSLLRVEAASSRAFYPHRLFEAGEVAIPDSAHILGSRTMIVAAAMIAHADAHFSEMHSCLDALFYYLDRRYRLEPIQHPSFLEGRAGRVVLEGGPALGVIGEIHPEVLERWQITVPVVAFEVDLTTLEGKK